MKYFYFLLLFLSFSSCQEKKQDDVNNLPSTSDEEMEDECHLSLQDGESKYYDYPVFYLYYQSEYFPKISNFNLGKLLFFHNGNPYELDLKTGKYNPTNKPYDAYNFTYAKDNFDSCVWYIDKGERIIKMNSSNRKLDTIGFFFDCLEIFPQKDRIVLYCKDYILGLNKKSFKTDTLLFSKNIANVDFRDYYKINNNSVLVEDSLILNINNLTFKKIEFNSKFQYKHKNHRWTNDSIFTFVQDHYIKRKISELDEKNWISYSTNKTTDLEGITDSTPKPPLHKYIEFGKDTLLAFAGTSFDIYRDSKGKIYVFLYCVKERKLFFYPQKQLVFNMLKDGCNVYWFGYKRIKAESKKTFISKLKPFNLDSFLIVRNQFDKEKKSISISTSKNDEMLFIKLLKLQKKYEFSPDAYIPSGLYALEDSLKNRFLKNNENYLKKVIYSNHYTLEYKLNCWDRIQGIWAAKLQFDSILVHYPKFMKINQPSKTYIGYKPTENYSAVKMYSQLSKQMIDSDKIDSITYLKICALEKLVLDFHIDTIYPLNSILLKELKSFPKEFPKSKFLDNVELKLILNSYSFDSEEKTVSKLLKFKRKYPNSDAKDEVDYWLLSNNITDKNSNQYCTPEQFLKKHPKSKYVKEIKKML